MTLRVNTETVYEVTTTEQKERGTTAPDLGDATTNRWSKLALAPEK